MALTDKKLDAREQRFVDEYLLDLDPKRAALAAGYAETTASTKSFGWVSNSQSTKPHVFAAAAKAKAQRSEQTKIDADWVLETIFDTVERCKQARPVVDKKGDPVLVETPGGQMAPAYAFQPLAVLKGVDLAGKHLGMFATKTVLTGPNDGPIQVEDVTPMERARRIGNALRKVAEENTD